MDWIGLAITTAAALALLVGIGWLLIFGTRNEWPDGTRVSATFRGHSAEVVWARGANVAGADVLAVAKAAWAVSRAWRIVRGENRFGDLELVGAWILPDDAFEIEAAKSHADPSAAQAYLVHVRRRLGQGPPLIVMRASLVAHLVETGQPAIHELLHAMPGLYGDRLHVTADVWEKPGAVTAEGSASSYYRVVGSVEA
jgi:hypothetical protein